MPSGKSGSKNCEQKVHTCTRLYMEMVWSSRRISLDTSAGSHDILHKEKIKNYINKNNHQRDTNPITTTYLRFTTCFRMTFTSIQSRGNFTSHRLHTRKKSIVVSGAGASPALLESPKLSKSELLRLASSTTGAVLGLAHSRVPGRLLLFVGGLDIFTDALVPGREGEPCCRGVRLLDPSSDA